MIGQGLESWAPLERLAVMGLVELVCHLLELSRIRRRLYQRLLADPPAVFVGIDAHRISTSGWSVVCMPAASPPCIMPAPRSGPVTLDRGRLSVMLQRDNGEVLRIRTISERTLLGEMAFYLGEPRSASVVVERPSVVHILSKEAYQRLGAAHPAAAQALGLMVIRILAVRGKMATKLISAYER